MVLLLVERFLEWLASQRNFINENFPVQAKAHDSSSTTTTTASTTATTRSIVCSPLCYSLSPCYWRLGLEFCFAWIFQIGFASWYVLDYVWLYLRVKYYWRRDPSLWAFHIPLTTIPRTRAQRQESWKDQFCEFQQILSKATTTSTTTTIQQHLPYVFEDDHVLYILRSNLRARQLASMIMYGKSTAFFKQQLSNSNNNDNNNMIPRDNHPNVMTQCAQLQRIWPRALEILPAEGNKTDHHENYKPSNASSITTTTTTTTTSTSFSISLIIPAYKEGYKKLGQVLNHTLQRCINPQHVQVILVDAGGNTNISVPSSSSDKKNDNVNATTTTTATTTTLLLKDVLLQEFSFVLKRWGEFLVVQYKGTGGRGGCMNFGAQHATGKVYTFLHADTLLPPQWDIHVLSKLQVAANGTTQDRNDNNNDSRHPPTTTNLVAFAMGIDISTKGLGSLSMSGPPPGIVGADRFLGYIRCSICHLPYGDSTLSIPANVFHFVGGYPSQQPLMEDYELVRLLRKRAMLFSTTTRRRNSNNNNNNSSSSTTTAYQEQMCILPQRIACSPRRWQTLGVPCVVLSNAYCIYLYSQQHATAEDLFDYYYRKQQQQPTRASSSPTKTKTS